MRLASLKSRARPFWWRKRRISRYPPPAPRSREIKRGVIALALCFNSTLSGPNMSASRLLYGTTIFLGAFLLFLVEPMAAKQLLPLLGGSSAVWLTCLVFFQITLLLGYLYAHWITRCRASSGRQHVYLVTLAAAVILLAAQKIFPATLS